MTSGLINEYADVIVAPRGDVKSIKNVEFHSGIAKKSKFKRTHARKHGGWKAYFKMEYSCNMQTNGRRRSIGSIEWEKNNRKEHRTKMRVERIYPTWVKNSSESKIRHYFAQYSHPFDTLFMNASHANPHISWARPLNKIKCLVTWSCKQFIAIFSSSRTWYRKFFECGAKRYIKLSHCQMTIASNVNHSRCTCAQSQHTKSAHVTFNYLNRYTMAEMLFIHSIYA